MNLDYDVCVPARDAAQTLPDTLESIRSQAIQPRTVVVVDDGSRDHTRQVAQYYETEVVSTVGIGLAAAENVGLAALRAPYVAFVDADDVWCSGASVLFAQMWATAAASTAAVAGSAEYFAGPFTGCFAANHLSDPLEVTAEEMWERNRLVKSATLFKRQALSAVSGYRELPSAEDYDLALRLIGAGWRIVQSSTICCHVRVRRDSMTSRAEHMLRGEVEALRHFHLSQYRTARMPGLSLDDRLRKAWWRTVARMAHYGQDLSYAQRLLPLVSATWKERAVAYSLRYSSLATPAATSWRLVGMLRSVRQSTRGSASRALRGGRKEGEPRPT